MDNLGNHLALINRMSSDEYAFTRLNKIFVDENFQHKSKAELMDFATSDIDAYHNMLVNKLTKASSNNQIDSIVGLSNLLTHYPDYHKEQYVGNDGEILELSKHENIEFGKSVEFNRRVADLKVAVDKKMYSQSKGVRKDAKKYGAVNYEGTKISVSDIDKEFYAAQKSLEEFKTQFKDYTTEVEDTLKFYKFV